MHPPTTAPDSGAPPARDLRRLLVIAGWVAAAVIAVSTAASGVPSGAGPAAATIGLTVVALALWLVALQPGITDQRLLATCLVVSGVSGAALDLLHPSGPGYILAFMAVAAIGLRLPRRVALAAGAVVVLAAARPRPTHRSTR